MRSAALRLRAKTLFAIERAVCPPVPNFSGIPGSTPDHARLKIRTVTPRPSGFAQRKPQRYAGLTNSNSNSNIILQSRMMKFLEIVTLKVFNMISSLNARRTQYPHDTLSKELWTCVAGQ